MESGRVGAYRLIVILCIFSASIFFLNNNKKKFTTNTHIDLLDCKTSSIAKLSLEHAYEQMNSLFVSRDTDLIVKVVSQFKDQCMYDLIEKIIQKQPLTAVDTQQLAHLCMYFSGLSNRKLTPKEFTF